MQGLRIDKWCWAARFFKTRSLSTAAVDNGKVRCNEVRVKPAHALKIGDVLEIDNGATRWEVEILQLSEHRGSASVAQLMYRETEASLLKRQQSEEERRYFREPTAELKSRPTKRDRRLLDQY